MRRPNRPTVFSRLAATAACALALAAVPAAADWSQYGGPQRDFSLDEPPTLADWGDAGPRELWRRDLGPGYSALIADSKGERLFTQSRAGDEELVLALDAATGATLWEYRYPAPVEGVGMVDTSYGDAPQATPLLIDGRLIGLGFTGVLWAVDAEDGRPLWSKALGTELEVPIPYFGHAASPLWVPSTAGTGGVAVVLAGGALAFDPATGDLRWQNRDFDASYASPVLLETAFGRQIVAAGAGDVVGLNPADGTLLWRHEYRNPQRTILGTPLLIEEDLIFVSSYFLGSRGLRLVARDRVEQAWEQENFQVSHFNAVRDGSTVYTTFRKQLLALDGRTGDILWKERRFGAANLVQAGPESLILGEHGELMTAVLRPKGLERRQSARLLKDRSWTPPTVLGDRLFVRDQQVAVAFHLGAAGAAREEPQVAAVELPDGFGEAITRMETAVRRSDAEAVEAAAEALDAWSEDPEFGTWAAYHRGVGFWVLSQRPGTDQLSYLDRAVEAHKRAVELDSENVEAHALLGTLYSLYYKLAPRRGAVVGPLAGEHLSRALSLEPDNPRAQMIEALRLYYTPAPWGGDPEAGLKMLRGVIENHPIDASAGRVGARPLWLPAMAQASMARLLLGQKPPRKEEATQLVDAVLEAYPDHASARQLRASLDR
ncbi:MAG: PQQ-binding-like beta-propeller repeat protein [Acidobacteriota bacterium]